MRRIRFATSIHGDGLLLLRFFYRAVSERPSNKSGIVDAEHVRTLNTLHGCPIGVDDGGDAGVFRAGKKPDHQRDQPSRKNGTQEHSSKTNADVSRTDGVECGFRLWVQDGTVSNAKRKYTGAEQIDAENNAPEASHTEEHFPALVEENGEDDGESVFGEELLATEDYNQET